MTCTRPYMAIQWLNNGVPYPSGDERAKLKILKSEDVSIVHNFYDSDLSAFCKKELWPLHEGKNYKCFKLPCGKCSSCVLAYGKKWSVRGMMEYLDPKYHHFIEKELEDGTKIKTNRYEDIPHCFLTLTIDDEHYAAHGKFVKRDVLQKFFKRFRKELNVHVRYLACGEYGSLNNRPHYHAIIYGYYPHDASYVQVNALGDKVYYSAFLSSKWTYGHIFIGDVTPESIAYVAGYVAKKVDKLEELKALDSRYEEFPPFITMSRKPGLGTGFFKAFTSDFFHDDLYLNGFHYQVPRLFLEKMKESYPDIYDRIKNNRLQAAETAETKDPKTLQRLHELEDLFDLRLSKKVRNL